MYNHSYCLCVSGNLGYIVLQNLYSKGANIVCVLTDMHSDEIIEYCSKVTLKCFIGNPRDRKAFKWMNIQQVDFDYLLSINYLFILEEDILHRARIAINFHGSLLPKYRGRTPHVWAIINGEKECGITAHLMNAKCDDGDIIKQLHVKIDEEDTGAMFLEKYNKIYPNLVDEVVSVMESGKISTTKQDISKATYYGKRTPKDGGINWDWQKERIRNWVRAQAKPYPGAFSHIGNKKITIYKISFSDFGFVDTIPNGSVLTVIDRKPIVKTQNGSIVLEDYEFGEAIKAGHILRTLYNE